MKKFLRSIQTHFPFLQDTRYKIQFSMMQMSHIPHEYDFRAVRLFKPDKGQVFVDIGSNRGEAISSMLIMDNSDTRIIGFEPNPLIYTKLKNQFDKYKNVVVHNLGLAEEDSVHVLHVPFYRNWMFDGLASFKYQEAKDWLKSRLWQYDESKLSIHEITCQIKRLDDFELKPYFIKIDVQGYELEVLKGGIETIKKYSPVILVESINEEHIKFLRKFNYNFYHFKRGATAGRKWSTKYILHK